MKFKYLIITFIIIILIVILVTAFMPAFLSDGQSASSFQLLTMPLLIFMSFLLVGIIIFFLFNYRLLSLLEREDWPALSYYLEQIIYVKGRYSARKVKLLASSYLVISDYGSVLKLESKAILAKPSVVEKNALIFGSARVLSGDAKGAASFFHTYMDKGNANTRGWMRWFYGFSLLLSGDFNMAEKEFTYMSQSSNDGLITGLSSYFLQSSIAKYSMYPAQCRDIAEKGSKRVLEAYKTIEEWVKEAERMGVDIHVAIIRKYIDEAGLWLYNQGAENSEQTYCDRNDRNERADSREPSLLKRAEEKLAFEPIDIKL